MNDVLNKILPFKIDTITKLNGYENNNYKIISNSQSYIFKTYPYSFSLEKFLKAEITTLLYLQQEKNNLYPVPLPFNDNSLIHICNLNGEKKLCRLLSYLNGELIGDSQPSIETAQSLGQFLAELNLKLLGVENDSIAARQTQWDLQYFHLNKPLLKNIDNVADRNIIQYFLQQFEEIVRPEIQNLRKQIIHNDANEWNILLDNKEVTGLIDFGDLVFSPLINEIAISATYLAYDKDNYFEYIIPFLKSYNEINPLQENEVHLLYYLIAARLCTSICNSAYSKKKDPDNSYAYTSEKPALKMLHNWIRINPIHAKNIFRNAIGLKEETISSTKNIIKKRYEHISPLLSLSYDDPIQISRSAFQYMYDKSGGTYLDAYNNIPHVGHCHPEVVEAGQRQMAKLNTNTRYLYDHLAEYAEKLLAKFPKSLTKVYFVNSGSAASDLAIRLSKNYTQKSDILVVEHGYHGNTQVGIQISDYKFSSYKGIGQQPNIIKADIPDSYRGKYSGEKAGLHYATDLTKKLENYNSIAAFIAEPIVGCGGQIPLANGYLKEVYQFIRKQGGVCISDEVQTGFGRLGKHFWGFQFQNVVPDIVVLGKPMGNGHPIGAVVTTNEIAESFEKGVEFFSSYGGNPVSCVIGSIVLDIIEREGLQENAYQVGNYYKSLLNNLKIKHSCIGDVRGSGLFIGIDIVEPNTKIPNPKLAHHLKNEMRNRYILLSTDGPSNNVLKSKPPLCFTKENANQVTSELDDILTNF